MTPITIEFTVKTGAGCFREDSVTFATADRMFDFIAPTGAQPCKRVSY